MKWNVREMIADDMGSVAGYFVDADTDFLHGMGVDAAKVPPMETWTEMLSSGLKLPHAERQFHFVIWEIDDQPVGHSNINKLTYGETAAMHLHLWAPSMRGMGYGEQLLRETVGHYFERFELDRLYCEPYALNPAPNRILPKIGFEFLESEVTIPGMLNFEQEINRWVLSREKWTGISG